MVVDTAGNVYIADSLNSRVRRVDPSGDDHDIRGQRLARLRRGWRARRPRAAFYFPAGLALDTAGNLYIADYGNATVRKVDEIERRDHARWRAWVTRCSARRRAMAARRRRRFCRTALFGGVRMHAGTFISATSEPAAFAGSGLDGKITTYVTNFVAQNFAMDSAGAIYFADYRTNTVQKILPGGTRLWIGGQRHRRLGWRWRSGHIRTVHLPYGVAVDSKGAVYVADAGNAVIRKLTPVAFSVGAVANAANLQAFAPPVAGSGDASNPIAPGEIVVLFGAGMGPARLAVAAPQNGFFPTIARAERR